MEKIEKIEKIEKNDSILATKEGFEKSFSSGEFYNKQTRDEHHLNEIIDSLPIESGMKVLDLGTGSGYLSFPIAKRFPDIQIIGLDIVEKALETNRIKADEEGLNNIEFINYDGTIYPFDNCEFDMVISRYALHHFPDITKSISEVARVLKTEGFFFVSDPTPNVIDTKRFVDEYMQLKKDGHIKFYSKDEWVKLCAEAGMEFTRSFESTIRFPRKRDTSYGFDELIKKNDKRIIDSYMLEIIGNEIYITEQVNNILFQKWSD